MYYKVKEEILKEIYHNEFTEWDNNPNRRYTSLGLFLREKGIYPEDGNREVSHHFVNGQLRLGFRHPNFRAIPHKFADGTPGIYIGGAYMEFDRVHREVDVTFSPDEARKIADYLIKLALQVENNNVTMAEYDITQLVEPDSEHWIIMCEICGQSDFKPLGDKDGNLQYLRCKHDNNLIKTK